MPGSAERKPAGLDFWLAWVLASAGGLAAGFGLARVLAPATGGEVYYHTGAPSYGLVNGVVAWLVAGGVLGLMQWLILRRWASWAAWWLLAIILVLGAMGLRSAIDGGHVTIPWIPGGFMYGAGFGAVTGALLLLLLRRS